MHRGYIKLWRALQDLDLWEREKFTRGQAWVDLLLSANHKDGHVRISGQRIEVKRGESALSEVTLAKRWKWSRGKVRRFLAELESEMEQKIVQRKYNVTSLIEILNYEKYQGNGTADDTPDGHPIEHQTDTRWNTNKNVKNIFLSDSIEIGLSELLFSLIRLRNKNAKPPNFQSWAKSFDLMIRLDGRKPEEIEALIRWAQSDPFECTNVLSPDKLRKRYDQLFLKSQKNRPVVVQREYINLPGDSDE